MEAEHDMGQERGTISWRERWKMAGLVLVPCLFVFLVIPAFVVLLFRAVASAF